MAKLACQIANVLQRPSFFRQIENVVNVANIIKPVLRRRRHILNFKYKASMLILTYMHGRDGHDENCIQDRLWQIRRLAVFLFSTNRYRNDLSPY